MNIKKLVKLLEKRARGFTYEEVQEEFAVCEQNENAFAGAKKLNESDKCLFELAEETKEVEASAEKFFDAKNGIELIDVIESPQKRKRGRPKKTEKEKKTEAKNGMSLVKRKVHTFFVPPDMTAIKMLIEFEGQPTDSYDDVTELAEKRRMLLEEIKKELLGDDGNED